MSPLSARMPGEDATQEVSGSAQVDPLLTEIDHIAIAVNDLGDAIDYYRETFGHRPGEFPVCEDVAARSIALPFFPAMTEGQVARVADALREVLVAARS